MSLTKLNYSKADKVIDIYASLLESLPNLPLYDKYGYADMKGYDIIDILNSLRLITAYRVYITNTIDDKTLTEFKKYASEDGGAVFNYFNHFVPDNEKAEMDKLDKHSPDFLINSIRIISDFQESDLYKVVMKNETSTSFLDFCIGIKGDSKYWDKVFKRLSLDCETEAEYDKIYYEIKKEQNKGQTKNSPTIDGVVDTDKKEKTKEISTPSFYDKYSTVIFHLLIICILIWCIFNILARNIFFSLVILLYIPLIYNFLKKNPPKNNAKFNFIINVFTLILVTIGFFNPIIGFYAIFFCILSQGIDLCKHLIITYLRARSGGHVPKIILWFIKH
ncbi:MAG: hypothetical protein K8R85_14730 [Bacteroidetes bacterium]|nr:hypothetical protein [Bacteroidota bacterium]